MKTIVLILGLVAFSLTSAPAFAGSCGGGDHTHPTDSSTKTKVRVPDLLRVNIKMAKRPTSVGLFLSANSETN